MKRTIKGIRADMGLTADEFAEKLETTGDVINNYEIGRTIPNIIFVNKLLKLTGLKYEDIIFYPENTTKSER